MRSLERRAISFLQKHCNGNSAVSFSGGKDSLVVLDLAVRAGIKKAVFCDTTIEFKGTLEYVKTIQDFYNIELDVVKSPKDFFEVAREVGFPSRRMRWCCDVFKFGPLTKYAKENGIEFFITGLRKDESNRRSLYNLKDENPVVPVTQINPLLDWTSEDVWNYINKYNLPVNSLYSFFERLGCWLCPYKTDKEWLIIEKRFPKLVEGLNTELEIYAEKLKIEDKERFIKRRGWTSWASPQEKTAIGFYRRPCGTRNNHKSELIYFRTNEKEVERICKLLPVLTDDFRKIGKHIRISIDDISERKLNILIEKALNCISCGACLSVCKQNALYIENDSIKVDPSKCNHCGRCINTNVLKGACIARNYSNNRKTIISSE